jgi:hypothetical protein
MAYLSDGSSSVSNFSECVISFICRVPQEDIDAFKSPNYVEFGDPAAPSGIASTLSGSFIGGFSGVEDGYTFTIDGDPVGPRTASIGLDPPAITLAADTYRRVIISFDLSTGAVFTQDDISGDYSIVSNEFRLWISVDDTDHSPTSYALGLNTFTGQPAGSIIPSFGSFTSGDLSLPGFSIAISGLEFAIACLAANADPSYNPKFQMADFLMWTGVSLDTSVEANRRLFITAAGRPVHPSVAIAALGTPVYDFRGPASSVETNLGSAGSVTKTGTVTDYTPGP